MNTFFETKEDRTGYLGFPHYVQEDLLAPYTVEIHLETEADQIAFAKLIDNENILEDKKRAIISLWYPAAERGTGGSNAQYVWLEK